MAALSYQLATLATGSHNHFIKSVVSFSVIRFCGNLVCCGSMLQLLMIERCREKFLDCMWSKLCAELFQNVILSSY